MIPRRVAPRVISLDGVQFDPVCPTCLTELRSMPRGKKPCPACGVMMYARLIDGERAVCNDQGLAELAVYRKEATAYVGVPCVVCRCTIDRYWTICAHCEQPQDTADPAAARGRLTPRQIEKVIERQVLESVPEILEQAWDEMPAAQKLLWMARWSPPLPGRLAIRLTVACASCGRLVGASGRCVECHLDPVR